MNNYKYKKYKYKYYYLKYGGNLNIDKQKYSNDDYDYKYKKYKYKYYYLKYGGNLNIDKQKYSNNDYKYKKYKYKYYYLKYGGNEIIDRKKYSNDFVYILLENIDDYVQKKITNPISNLKNIEQLNANIKKQLNSVKSFDSIFKELQQTQTLMLCIACNIINSSNTFLNFILEYIEKLINKEQIVASLFKTSVPCIGEIIDLVQQILNKVFKTDKYNFELLKLTLVFLNLFNMDSKTLDYNMTNLSVNITKLNMNRDTINGIKDVMKKMGLQINDLDISKVLNNIRNSDIYFNTINLPNEIYKNLENLLNESIKNINKGIQDINKGVNKGIQDINKGVNKGIQDINKGVQDINKGLNDNLNILNQNIKNFKLWGGGALGDNYIKMKEDQAWDIIFNGIKTYFKKMDSKNIINGCLLVLRLLIIGIKTNLNILNLSNDNKSLNNNDMIKNIYFDTIDSILCLFLTLTNIDQAVINYLKTSIHYYLGKELSGLSIIINNFIQSLYDTFIIRSCGNNIINLDANKIAKMTPPLLENNQQKPTSPAPVANNQQKPTSPEPVANNQQKPTSPEPVANNQQKPTSPEPVANNQQKPTSPAPVANNQQKPTSPAPVANNQQKPTSPEPVANNQQKPTSPAPVANNQQKPTSPAPVANNQQKPTSPAPVANNQQKPTSPAPVANNQQKPVVNNQQKPATNNQQK
jgi:hypothetical protein